METVWITALAIAVLSVSRCGGQLLPYAPCQPVNKLFEFPGNCNKYLSCTTSGLYPMDCPWILVFDESRQQCEWPYVVPKCRALGPCQPSPCANGGQCAINGAGGYTCNCTGTGFGGATCTIDYCNRNPCTHGRCVSDSAGFSCDCRGSGYRGVFCDIPVNENSTCLTNNPCVRGTCLKLASGVFCDCQGTGYTGETCNQPVIGGNYCYPGACANGVCVSGASSYVCNCSGTVNTGPRCDMTACDFLEYNPCMNGGTCTPQPRETYTCACALGFQGGNCETLLIPPGCPTHQCPTDVPRYNYPDWNDQTCSTYYNCQNGNLQLRSCSPGQKFDVITMICKQSPDPQAVFCDEFRK